MNQESNDAYSDLLKAFDQLKLSNAHERRMGCKPLYDFFQRSIREVGVALCGLDENSLRIYHLKTRWENIKIQLSYIEDPKIWDDLINEMNNIRHKVEHDDYYDPKLGRLKAIRSKAPEFRDWVINVAKEYYKQSKNFTFKEAFFQTLDSYIMEAEWLTREYGEKTPHAAESDYSIMDQEDSYTQLMQLLTTLRERMKDIVKLEDLERSDLEDLIKIVKIVSQIRGREEILLRYSVCPKCGGKIVESERAFGGSFEDPEPEGFVYRVGCEKCDYELYSETFSI